MEILVKSIDDPTNVAQRINLRVTQFNVDFENPTVSGKAQLFVMHSSPNFDMNLVRQQVVGRMIQVDVSCEKIYDFTVISGEGYEHVESLGASGGFFFEGRITEHLFTGEGSIFQARDVSMIIGVDMLPPYSLEVEVGTWVSFKTEKVSFLLRSN